MEFFAFDAQQEVSGKRLEGIAHVFGTRTVRGGEVWSFDAGAFDASLRTKAVFAFYAHDQGKPLASMDAGTLRAGVVKSGGLYHLEYDMDLGSQSYADDLRENVASGLMKRASFGVTFGESEVRKIDGQRVRVHTQSGLFDISPVVLPAFEATNTALHSATVVGQREHIIRAMARAGGLRA